MFTVAVIFKKMNPKHSVHFSKFSPSSIILFPRYAGNIFRFLVTAVRYGRVPKRSRERSTEEQSRVSTSDAEQSDPDTKQLAVYDVILTVSQAHHANCGYTEEQTRGLVRKPITLPVSTWALSEENN